MLESGVRHPRAMVLVNGTRVAWTDIEVNSNGYYQADSFRVVLPVSNQPPEVTREWWNAQNPMVVEIYTGFPSNPNAYGKDDLTLLIMGEVDDFSTKMVEGVVNLVGRDYSALLIETKIILGDRLNRTASDVAIEYATKYGLTTTHITKTTVKIGRIYELSYTKMQHAVTEWDLICLLAGESGFQVFIKGIDLHFEAKPPTAPIYTLTWKDADSKGGKRFDGAELICQRNLTLAKDIIVYVRVKNKKTGKFFTTLAHASHSRDKVLNKGKRYIGKPQVHMERLMGSMDKEQAQAKANEILAELSRHQVRLDITGIPADNVLTPQHIIKLVGTSDYDQQYHPDQIIRKFDMNSGYTMDILAKNHDVNSQVLI